MNTAKPDRETPINCESIGTLRGGTTSLWSFSLNKWLNAIIFYLVCSNACYLRGYRVTTFSNKRNVWRTLHHARRGETDRCQDRWLALSSGKHPRNECGVEKYTYMVIAQCHDFLFYVSVPKPTTPHAPRPLIHSFHYSSYLSNTFC